MDIRRHIIDLLLADPIIAPQLGTYLGQPAVFRGQPIIGHRLEPFAFDEGTGPYAGTATHSDGTPFSFLLTSGVSKCAIFVDPESVDGTPDTFSERIVSLAVPIRIYARSTGDDSILSAVAWRVRSLLHQGRVAVEGGTLGSMVARGPMPLPTGDDLLDGRVLYAAATIEED